MAFLPPCFISSTSIKMENVLMMGIVFDYSCWCTFFFLFLCHFLLLHFQVKTWFSIASEIIKVEKVFIVENYISMNKINLRVFFLLSYNKYLIFFCKMFSFLNKKKKREKSRRNEKKSRDSCFVISAYFVHVNVNARSLNEKNLD